jgi:hypothetical protein
MYNILVTTHSILRWLLVLSFIVTIFYALYSRYSYKSFPPTLKKLSMITFNVVNLQFVIGLILYFVSPKVILSSLAMKAPLTRFFLVEHVTAMLIAIVLISIGYSKTKKATTDAAKYNRLLGFYITGFLIILAAVPWPFYNLGTAWF